MYAKSYINYQFNFVQTPEHDVCHMSITRFLVNIPLPTLRKEV